MLNKQIQFPLFVGTKEYKKLPNPKKFHKNLYLTTQVEGFTWNFKKLDFMRRAGEVQTLFKEQFRVKYKQFY